MKSTKIGFFDSGIGGVTVLRECIKLVSDFSYIYYSDSVNNPYGDKSRDEVLGIASNIVDYFENRYYVAAAKETGNVEEETVEVGNLTSKEVSKVSSDERKLIDEILREYLGW